MSDPRLQGLYAVTSAALLSDPATRGPRVAAALRGGARLLQYRDKRADAGERRRAAIELLAACHHHGALFIVNDDVALAAEIGADGVHLGARDAPVGAARRQLGRAAVIGVSCGPQLERAMTAARAGASYAAFGRFFASQTKPDAPQAALAVLAEARKRLDIPVCAIGGITPANAGEVITAGADMVAAVAGLFDVADVEAAARAYARQF